MTATDTLFLFFSLSLYLSSHDFCQLKLIYVLFYNLQNSKPHRTRLSSPFNQFENDKLPHYRNILCAFYYFEPQREAKQHKKGQTFFAHCIFIRDNHALSGQRPGGIYSSDRPNPRSRTTHYAAYASYETDQRAKPFFLHYFL